MPPRRDPPPRPEAPPRHRLWVRLPDKEHPAVRRIELILQSKDRVSLEALAAELQGQKQAAAAERTLILETKYCARRGAAIPRGAGKRRRHGGENALTRRALYGILIANLFPAPDRHRAGRQLRSVMIRNGRWP